MQKFKPVLIAFLALASACIASVPVAAENLYGSPDAKPAPFNPQMAALMSMLIQPRHAKLGLAGKAENWTLAAYSLRELMQGFIVAGKAVPRWKGLPVPDLFNASVDHPMRQINVAITLKSSSQFDEAYTRLTEACNACHATTDHSFIVIKAPNASSFPNQDFVPKR